MRSAPAAAGPGSAPIFQKCAVEIGDEGNFQAGEGLRQAGGRKGHRRLPVCALLPADQYYSQSRRSESGPAPLFPTSMSIPSAFSIVHRGQKTEGILCVKKNQGALSFFLLGGDFLNAVGGDGDPPFSDGD